MKENGVLKFVKEIAHVCVSYNTMSNTMVNSQKSFAYKKL